MRWNNDFKIHFTEMGKFEFTSVAVMMMVLAVGTHAADNLDDAWEKYLVTLF